MSKTAFFRFMGKKEWLALTRMSKRERFRQQTSKRLSGSIRANVRLGNQAGE
jgi:hypothetical protein